MSQAYDVLFKLLLIGDSGVGKSSLLYRFTDDAFNKTYVSTIGIDFKIKTIQVDGKIIRLQIWDTAGQERFQTITKSYYRGAMGVMLLFDITNPKTFENIGKWIRDIDEHATPNVDKILVGNKCDMESQRAVEKEIAQRLAQEYSLAYIETSSKTNINIEESFKLLAKQILQRVGVSTPLTQSRLSLNQEAPKKTSKCC